MPRKRKKQKQVHGRLNDEQFVEQFCQVLRDGCYGKTACRLFGVPHSTYKSWREKGEAELERCWAPVVEGGDPLDPDPSQVPFVNFVLQHDKACAEAEIETVRSLRKAGMGGIKGDWRAAEAWLRRRFPHWSDAGQREAAKASTTVVHVHTGIPGVDE